MPEVGARSRFPNLVVASLGAQKEKHGGVLSARVVFDETNGNFVSTSTRLRDQERASVAADLKRLMRKKNKVWSGHSLADSRCQRSTPGWDVSSKEEERYL